MYASTRYVLNPRRPGLGIAPLVAISAGSSIVRGVSKLFGGGPAEYPSGNPADLAIMDGLLAAGNLAALRTIAAGGTLRGGTPDWPANPGEVLNWSSTADPQGQAGLAAERKYAADLLATATGATAPILGADLQAQVRAAAAGASAAFLGPAPGQAPLSTAGIAGGVSPLVLVALGVGALLFFTKGKR